MNRLEELKAFVRDEVYRCVYDDIQYDLYIHKSKLFLRTKFLYGYQNIIPIHEVDFIFKHGQYSFDRIYKNVKEGIKIDIIPL